MKQDLTITGEDAPTAGLRILHLDGPVVLETLFKFRDALGGEKAPNLILDFTQVPYMDSAGLGSMIRAFVRFQDEKRGLILVGMNAKCRALLQMTQVESTFRIFPTLEEALREPH